MSTLQSAKGIILCDLDETILSPEKKLTAPLDDLKFSVAHAQQVGYLIGLCSDSSFETLTEYAATYGMNGPLVVEKGAAYAVSKDSTCIGLPGTKVFPYIRDAFLSVLAVQKYDHPYHVICGDANRIIEDLAQFDSAQFGDTMIVVNGLRHYSFSFYVRKRISGRWERDTKKLIELEKVATAVGSFSKTWSNVVIDRNDQYGICIFHHRYTSKTAGVEYVMGSFKDVPFYMIGDSIADRILLQNVSLCAVANAQEEYKQHCERIATHSFTEGVIELIDAIVGHHS